MTESDQKAADRQQVVNDLANLVEDGAAGVATSVTQAQLLVAMGRALLVLLEESHAD